MVDALSAVAARVRPPTPPKTSSRSELLEQTVHRTGSTDILPETPEDSPVSSQAALSGSQRRLGSKRVDFSPWTDYIKPLPFNKTSSQSKLSLKVLRPSNECRPTKSILKSSTVPLPQHPSDQQPTNEPESLITMWESAVQQLSGDCPNSRLDAYMHLFGTLKAYDGFLEDSGIAEKIGLLTQFIQRDIRQESGKYETQEINLISYALKLLTVLVWNSRLATHLPDEFRSFVIDRSTGALQEPNIPKTILTHYMHLLSTQTFPQKIMTGNRALKLLTILQSITDHVNGNAVIAQRLMIYQRLLTQSKPLMANHANLWIQHLLTGLFHHIKDTRMKAVAFGLQATTTFGSNISISNAVRATLNTLSEDGRRYISKIVDEMTRMISSREKGAHVPQIWSVVILLLRNRKSSVEKWEHFKEWVLIIQKCFNCSDPAAKTQAIQAWNRFVFAVAPSESTSMSMIRMLSKPIISQIERRKTEKLGAQPNSTTFSSYCNLLYYAFRPSASHKQLDIFWKEYVVPPFSTVFNSGSALNDRACQILFSLLWNPQPKVWSENRANEATKLEPDELPVLDCKWVRSRVSFILEVFESLFKTSTWREDDFHESNIALAWTSFSKALSEASSKEIKTSTESMHAIASVLGMFQRIWNRGPAALNVDLDCPEDAFLDRFRFLSETIVSALGPIPFTENFLLKSSSQDTFQTTNTPSHRRPRTDGNCKTPVLHLLHLISSLPATVNPGPAYRLLISEILNICSHARSSRGSRLDLLRQFTEFHRNVNDSRSATPDCAGYIWEVSSGLVRESLHYISSDTAKERGSFLTREHVDTVVKVLEAGIQFRESLSEWSELTNVLVGVVQSERKEDTIAATVIGPLSEYLQSQDINTTAAHAAVLLRLAVYPANQASDSHSPRRPKPNPYLVPHVDYSEIGYGKLVKLTEETLINSYHRFQELDISFMSSFIEAVDYSMSSCPPQLRPTALKGLQSGVSLWLADRDHRLNKDLDTIRKLLIAVRKVSKHVVSILEGLAEHDGEQLKTFEVLISSGLETFHKSIANMFILMWNNTFGLQNYLEYPKSVELALRKLEPYVDLQLPSFPRSTNFEEGEPAPPEFLDSQNDLTNRATQMRSFDQQKLVSSPLNLVLSSRVNSSSPVNQPDNQSTNGFQRSAARTPKSRRRHDDSQVEFVAVESSPLEHEQDSQYFTEHQRDVRERQRNETANMFPDFKSSSPQAVTRLTPGKLREQPGLKTETDDDPDGVPEDTPMTPTLAGTMGENEDEFPISSPTPTSQNPKSILAEDIAVLSSSLTTRGADGQKPVDPPSSPPDFQSRRSDLRATSEAISLPPEVEPDSQESHDQGLNAEIMGSTPSATSPTCHAEENGKESILKDVSQEMVESSSDQESEELAPGNEQKGDREMMKPIIRSSDAPLVDSTPDAAYVNMELSQSVDYGTPSHSKSTSGIDIVPDSFVSDVDDQVASQLGQDLEQAVTPVKGREEETPKKAKLSSSARRALRKRRRQETLGPQKDAKRMRTRSTGPLPEIEGNSGDKGKEIRNSKVPNTTARSNQPEVESRSHTPVSATRTRRTRADHKELPASTAKSQKRSRSLAAEDEREDSEVGDSRPVQPSPKKLRSSRLTSEQVLPDSLPQRKGKKSKQKKPKPSNHKETTTLQRSQAEEATKATESRQDSCSGSATVLTGDNSGMKVVIGSTEVDNINSALDRPRRVSQGTQTDAPADREVEASEAGILGSLRRVLSAIRTVTWGRPALREIDDVMFDIRVEAHDANRRHAE